MEHSDDIKDLAGALAKAQGEVEGAVKGKANPAFKSKYADLASVWEACRAALSGNGLSVIQSPGVVADGKMTMTTMLMHASGQWIRDSLTIPVGKMDAHGFGSATTYARRFALAAFVGVAPEDDDGNAAVKSPPANEGKAQAPTPPTLSERADRLEATLKAVKSEDELRKAFSLASGLCADLDAKDPDRLAEIEKLYASRFESFGQVAA